MLQNLFGKISRNLKHSGVVFAFISVSLLTVCTLFIFLWVLQVREVVFVGDVTAPGIHTQGSDAILGSFLFQDDKYFKGIVEYYNPSSQVVLVKKKYPGQVQIQVEKIVPVLYIDHDGYFAILSGDAKIIKWQETAPKEVGMLTVPPTFLPAILRPGEHIVSKEVKFAAKIAKIVKNQSISAFRIEITDSSLIECILPATNTHIKMSAEMNQNISLLRLSDFLGKLYTSGKSIKVLDLRFEKAVIEQG